MTSAIDDQWDFINPPASTSTSTTTSTMAATTEQPSNPARAPEPIIEVSTNTNSAEETDVPKLTRKHSIDSVMSDSDVDVEILPRARPARRNRRDSVSPVRIHNRYVTLRPNTCVATTTQHGRPQPKISGAETPLEEFR